MARKDKILKSKIENRNIKIYAKLFDGDFLDIGTPDDYSKSETFVNKVY